MRKLFIFIGILMILPLVFAGTTFFDNQNEFFIMDEVTPPTPVVPPTAGGGGGGGPVGVPECFENLDCSIGEFCFENKCYVQECETDFDCNDTKTCWMNRCVKLFDMKIVEVQSPIYAGEFFNFTYFLKGVAEIHGDVVVNFWLVKDGEVVTEGFDTIYMGDFEEKLESTELFLPATILPGVYNFYAEVNYDSYYARAGRIIEIEEILEEVPEVEERGITITGKFIGQIGEGVKANFLIISILLLLIILIILFYLKRKKLGKWWKEVLKTQKAKRLESKRIKEREAIEEIKSQKELQVVEEKRVADVKKQKLESERIEKRQKAEARKEREKLERIKLREKRKKNIKKYFVNVSGNIRQSRRKAKLNRKKKQRENAIRSKQLQERKQQLDLKRVGEKKELEMKKQKLELERASERKRVEARREKLKLKRIESRQKTREEVKKYFVTSYGKIKKKREEKNIVKLKETKKREKKEKIIRARAVLEAKKRRKELRLKEIQENKERARLEKEKKIQEKIDNARLEKLKEIKEEIEKIEGKEKVRLKNVAMPKRTTKNFTGFFKNLEKDLDEKKFIREEKRRKKLLEKKRQRENNLEKEIKEDLLRKEKRKVTKIPETFIKKKEFEDLNKRSKKRFFDSLRENEVDKIKPLPREKIEYTPKVESFREPLTKFEDLNKPKREKEEFDLKKLLEKEFDNSKNSLGRDKEERRRKKILRENKRKTISLEKKNRRMERIGKKKLDNLMHPKKKFFDFLNKLKEDED
ncbi:hypothetical protein HOD29_05910 [archaeon]|jgi:hypothetical protein|nr:hypothetical protein [archaeon]